MEENTYNELIGKIKDILNDAAKKGNVLSYTDLGKELSITPEMVKEVVGRRFSELTKKAFDPFSDADPDFYLLGDNIKEICNNKQYLRFKKMKFKQQEKTAKFLNATDKINRI